MNEVNNKFYFFKFLKKDAKNCLKIIFIINFILILIVVIRAINSKRNLKEYKEIEKNLVEKLENNVKFEYSEDVDINQDIKTDSLVDCLKKPLGENDITDEMKNISKELENTMNESKYNFAFKYKDLNTGFSLSYNSSQPIFAASTIKAPEAIYIYEEAEKGNINLDDTITYTANYYSDGTGILKNRQFNVDYSVRELVSYSIIHSDNAAHLMLNNKYKSENIYNYWSNLGTTVIYKNNTKWGDINANDATIYMTELYNYVSKDNQYSKELLDYFKKSWKIISIPNKDIVIASKSGWRDYSLHDVSLIFDKNPYTLTILSNRGYTDYESFFNKISNLIYNFHQMYWQKKINSCVE